MPSGLVHGAGCPFPSRLGIWGSVVSSLMESPAENGFWRILKATERSFLHLYDKIWGRQFALESPLQILGDLSPVSVIYAHDFWHSALFSKLKSEFSIPSLSVRFTYSFITAISGWLISNIPVSCSSKSRFDVMKSGRNKLS